MHVFHFQTNGTNYFVSAQSVEAAYSVLPKSGHADSVALSNLAYRQLPDEECEKRFIPPGPPIQNFDGATIASFTGGDQESFTQHLNCCHAFRDYAPKLILETTAS